MKTQTYLAILLCALFTASCSKDDNQDEQIDTEKFVKSEWVSEDINIAYTYNNNLLATATGNYSNVDYTSTFTYNPDGKLTKWQQMESGTSDTDIQTFTYNPDGRLAGYVSDFENVSITYDGNIATLTGRIEGDDNASAILELNENGLVTKFTESNQYTVFQYDGNGNIIKAETFDNDDTLLTSFTIAYDSKINPFYGQLSSIYIERFIEFFWEFDGIYYSGLEGYSFPFQKSNIVSIIESSETILEYTYTYNNENYPISVSEDDNGDVFDFEILY